MHWTSPYRDPLALPLCSRHRISLYRPTPRHVQTYPTWTSLNRDPLPPAPYMLKLVRYEALTIDKRAVRILLECFLVPKVYTLYQLLGSRYLAMLWCHKFILVCFCWLACFVVSAWSSLCFLYYALLIFF